MKIYDSYGLIKLFGHLLIIIKKEDESNEISLANSGTLEFFDKNLIANLTCAVQIWLTRLLHLLIFKEKQKNCQNNLCQNVYFF